MGSQRFFLLPSREWHGEPKGPQGFQKGNDIGSHRAQRDSKKGVACKDKGHIWIPSMSDLGPITTYPGEVMLSTHLPGPLPLEEGTALVHKGFARQALQSPSAKIAAVGFKPKAKPRGRAELELSRG